MSERERPRLAFEDGDFANRPPHCDPRILHHPDDGCDFCYEAVALQMERERLGVSNTGRTNRAFPCPADVARSSKAYNAWHGNRAVTHAQIEEEVAKFGEELAAATFAAALKSPGDGK